MGDGVHKDISTLAYLYQRSLKDLHPPPVTEMTIEQLVAAGAQMPKEEPTKKGDKKNSA